MSKGMTELGMVTDYPEHDKLHAVNERSQAVGEFLGWLSERFVICEWVDQDQADELCLVCGSDASGFHPAGKTIEEWLTEHFKIDQAKLEEEKRAMLDIVRKAYDASA